MAKRKPQINFQVNEPLKVLYEMAGLFGLSVTRLCAAGLLFLVARPDQRMEALKLLEQWEREHATSSEEQIRAFVEQAIVGGKGPTARKQRRGKRRIL